MFCYPGKRIVIQRILPGAKTGWKRIFRSRRENRLVLKLLQEKIRPGLSSCLPVTDISVGYPWCFVFSATNLKKKYYYIGALTAPEGELSVLYVRVSYRWLERELQKSQHLAFWLTRIIASLSDGESQPDNIAVVYRWLTALQRYYSWPAVWKRKSYFHRHTSVLSSPCCAGDYTASGEDGVSCIPWSHWPGCIQNGELAWLWRINRHGGVIESRTITLTRD